MGTTNPVNANPIPADEAKPIGAVMVVGGGIAGLQAALDLRKDVEGLLSGQTIDREPAPIQRKDAICLQVFAQRHERGIGKVHRRITVFLHQGGNAPQTLARGRNQHESAAQQKFEADVLRLPGRSGSVTS